MRDSEQRPLRTSLDQRHQEIAFVLIQPALQFSRVRQLNAQVIVSYERQFKNVYYKRESCFGFVGFFNLNAAKTRSCVSERREIPVTGRSA